MAIFHTLHIVSDDRHVVFFGDHQVGSIWVSKVAEPTFQAAGDSRVPILLSGKALLQLAMLVESFKPKPTLCGFVGCRRLAEHRGPCSTVDAQAQLWDSIDEQRLEPVVVTIRGGRRS